MAFADEVTRGVQRTIEVIEAYLIKRLVVAYSNHIVAEGHERHVDGCDPAEQIRINRSCQNESVNQTYSQVNVVQQRRLDLIPNLVASVKGYVAEESTILTNIANARAGVLAAGPDRASSINANGSAGSAA